MDRPTTTKYFMEDPREKQRLVDKVAPQDWAEKYVYPLIDSNSKVLDVGCGPAVLAKAVAGKAGSVTGLERSDDRFNQATQNLSDKSNANVVQGDATQLPFDDGEFDFVYTRFMLQYLPERDTVISEMFRVCRPGGKIMMQDLDGQLVWHYPLDNELQNKIDKITAGLIDSGFDPYLGRKLFHKAKTVGLTGLDVICEPYHFFAGTIDDHNYELWDLKLEIALPTIAKVLGGDNEAVDFKAEFMDYLKRDDTLTYSNVFTVVGSKPA